MRNFDYPLESQIAITFRWICSLFIYIFDSFFSEFDKIYFLKLSIRVFMLEVNQISAQMVDLTQRLEALWGYL
jgi:hypothetical protein